MTRWFCDRCGNEIKTIGSGKGEHMTIRRRTTAFREHDVLLCERCSQEFKRWYEEGKK